MKTTEDLFFKLYSKFDIIPFVQSKGWYDYTGCGRNKEFWVDSEIDVNIGLWATYTRHRIIGKKLIIEGICYKSNISSKIITRFFSDLLKTTDANIVEFSDIQNNDAEFEIALRRSGFLRPICLGLCPMTIIVDCQKDFNFHRNWKRQVKKSVESENTFHVIKNPNVEDLNEFSRLFNQLKSRKSLSFNVDPEQLKKLFADDHYFISFIEDSNGRKLCGRITYLYNGHAYDIFAANSDESLQCGAIYHNQQGLLEYLKEIGAIDFDYGRIPPGTDDMDSIYISKSYSGGHPVIYNGQWNFSRNNLINWAYNFYVFVLRKHKRY